MPKKSTATNNIPVFDGKVMLEKYPGKGGWTYAQIPTSVRDKTKAFGYVRVKGTIDSAEIRGYHLMPMKGGNLFLPVKSEIRKKIGKQEGDIVRIILFVDDQPVDIPDELRECLDDAGIWKLFISKSFAEQKAWVDFVYEAKMQETRVKRISKMIDRLIAGI